MIETKPRQCPLKALYGQDSTKFLKGTKVEEVNRLTQETDELLQELRGYLIEAQDKMTAQANKHRRQLDFHIGDLIFLNWQPYKMK